MECSKNLASVSTAKFKKLHFEVDRLPTNQNSLIKVRFLPQQMMIMLGKPVRFVAHVLQQS